MGPSAPAKLVNIALDLEEGRLVVLQAVPVKASGRGIGDVVSKHAIAMTIGSGEAREAS